MQTEPACGVSFCIHKEYTYDVFFLGLGKVCVVRENSSIFQKNVSCVVFLFNEFSDTTDTSIAGLAVVVADHRLGALSDSHHAHDVIIRRQLANDVWLNVNDTNVIILLA